MPKWSKKDLAGYKTIKRMLSRKTGDWRDTGSPSYVALIQFRLFMDWLAENGGEFSEFNPDELVEYQKQHRDYQIVDLLQDYILQKDGHTAGTLQRYRSEVRSFFLHNRAELPSDPAFRVQPSKPPVNGSLSVNELKRIINSCNLMYGTVYTCMMMGGMGTNELVYWSNHGFKDLLKQLDSNVNPLKVDLPGRKMNKYKKPYYTLLGTDAIDALEAWIAKRGRQDGPIFKTMRDTPLKKQATYLYFSRHARELGIIIPEENGDSCTRYGVTPHEIRDLFRTRWHKSGADGKVAEFMMGHAIDKLGYNKAMRDIDYVKLEYLKAEPWLNIISEDPSTVSKELHERQKLKIDSQAKQIETLQKVLDEALRRIELLENEER